ncbi:MAG: aldehyde ferredoxin oxidoreductase family protein [Chloroflexota bacterium]
MGGYKNKILRVDLTTRKFEEQTLDDNLIHDYIGGRGFGVKLLYDNLKPGIDPMGPDNELVFLAGPLADSTAQSFHRWKVFFKSPLTGGYFKSCGGAHWGSELKATGLDAIIIRGISEKPVYLWIKEGQYEFRDAYYLTGLDCDDTHELIREELRDPLIRIACIGPAGENKVKYAGIFSDRRCAGRGGGGAVMGAKNLKAIALRGKQPMEYSDPAGFAEASKAWIEAIRTDRGYPFFSETGTQGTAATTNTLGMYPTKNFREGMLQGWEALDGAEFKKVRVRKTACHNCMIHCGSIIHINSGKWAGEWSEGPEYETIWGFSGPIGVADLGLTVAADHLCDRLGVDTISAAGAIGMAYELYEKGLITRSDTGGLELSYGNGSAAISLVEQIAYRKGVGDLLAEGVRFMAKKLDRGSEQYAMHVKGLEFPAYDPRGAKAHGLSLMTLPIGADHNSGYSFQEIFGTRYKGQKIDRFAVEQKGEITKWNQDFVAAQETGILCNFAGGYLRGNLQMFARLLYTATGVKDFEDEAYLWKVGERIYNLEQLFNVREGFNRKDDIMPDRITKETLPAGASAGKTFEAETLLDDYYKQRGWDTSGIPTAEKLQELGLGFTIKQ